MEIKGLAQSVLKGVEKLVTCGFLVNWEILDSKRTMSTRAGERRAHGPGPMQTEEAEAKAKLSSPVSV